MSGRLVLKGKLGLYQVADATNVSTQLIDAATGEYVGPIGSGEVNTDDIVDAAVTLAKLATGITPSHVIKFAGQKTTVGGAASEAFTITGAVAATDRAFLQVVNNGTSNVTILEAVVTTNTLTVTFSANPGNDTIFNYQLIRAAA